jgi:reactive intermediate/imine deaminase
LPPSPESASEAISAIGVYELEIMMPREILGNPAGRPYSPGTRFRNLIFVSGQLGLDGDGRLVEGGAAAETRQVLENVKSVLALAGATMDDVTMANVYLTDRASDFAQMNQVFGDYFGSQPPARATVEITRLALGARVEISVIATL